VDDYVLGRSDAETRRLIVQHQLYGPFTRQFLTAAGVTAGMRVLDVGSGAGDVALLAAELRQGDVMELDPDGDFDAVVGRWVLQYTPDPAALLRRARGWLRPGGIAAFQEIDLSIPPRAYPAGPLHEQVMRWTTPPPAAAAPGAPTPRWG
jgi:ubiquinone/menaquinone biosynthesis C-methylase UbiE